jgi:hypothetical protein
MSGLRARAEEYLVMRRALRFKLTSHRSRLMSFVRFCEDRGATTVTTPAKERQRPASRRPQPRAKFSRQRDHPR